VVKLNKIYTRTGDDGTTGLVDGSRVAKDAARMAAIGSVDEANSAIGVAAVVLAGGPYGAALTRIQNDMFDLGADLATPVPAAGERDADWVLRMIPAQTTWLEAAIDALNADLAPLNSFILPGGSEGAARVHVARASVRRAERAMVAMAADVATNPAALAYINRLSDYLFVLARAVNAGGAGDVLWVPGANRGG
jgi:cob(I)alamin adenosyltransferase